MNRQAESPSSKKLLASLVLFLMYSLTASMFLTGCSDNQPFWSADTTAVPPDVVAKVPFHNPPLRMIGELKRGAGTTQMVGLEGEGGGLVSWLIETVVEGLQEGLTSGIGEATTGKLFSGINGDGTAEQFSEINAQLTNISNQVNILIQQNAEILTEIKVTALQTQINTNQNDITTDAKDITSAWGVGDPNLGFTSSSYMDIATKAKAGMSKSNLNVLVGNFATQNTTKKQLQTGLTALHTRIVTNNVLTTFAKMLVTKGGITTTQDAENAYKSLQQQFGKILTYQIQAQLMIIELDNISDPNGAYGYASSDMGSFETMIMDECANFLSAVNMLMINLVDYRNSTNYATDSEYVQKYGLAPDVMYNMIFATSRALVAQLKSGFKLDNFGLHGAIVVPNLYKYPTSGASPTSPGPITVKFKGYSTSSKGVTFTGYSSTTITVPQPAATAGQFPYTAWSSSGQSYPDNQWLFYEFRATQDLPAGRYQIILVDDGNNPSATPWNHTETLFGTLNILWYDPTTSVGTPGNGTLAKTATNIFKFGSFSGRWNWGYHKLSMSPMADWKLPAKHTVQTSNVYPQISSWTEDNPTMSDLKAGSSYYPQPNFSTGIQSLGLNMVSTTNPVPMMMYTIELPFNVGPLPSGSTTGAAQLFYTTAATVNFNVSEAKSLSNAYFDYNLIDTTKSKTVSIAKYSSSAHSIKNLSLPYSGVFTTALTPGDKYQISVDAGLNNFVYSKCTTSGTIDLSWNMQIVYSNLLYPLP